MIQAFLSSKVSGWIAIVGIIAVLGLIGYIYNEGKTACVNEIESEQQEAEDSHETDTSKKNIDIDRQYEKVITKIVEVPSGCVSDSDKRTNQWLRQNYTNYSE